MRTIGIRKRTVSRLRPSRRMRGGGGRRTGTVRASRSSRALRIAPPARYGRDYDPAHGGFLREAGRHASSFAGAACRGQPAPSCLRGRSAGMPWGRFTGVRPVRPGGSPRKTRGARVVSVATRVASTVQLIGRASEIERMEVLLGRIDGGAAACLAVEGEPGIGKSSLLGELRRVRRVSWQSRAG